MREKSNKICDACSRNCKQPPSVVMVSCPKFDRADKTLDMFDSKGNIKTRLVNPSGKKKPPNIPRKKS